MKEHRQQAEEPLRQHVAGVRRVHFAVDRKRCRARQPSDADGGRGPFGVVLQPAGAEHGVEIGRAEIRRVLVGAARQQLAIP